MRCVSADRFADRAAADGRCGAIVVEDPPTLAKQLPRWFMWSPMARFVRERERLLAV